MADGSACLSDERVAELFEHELDASEVRSVAEHIDRCRTCRRVVAAAARAVDIPDDDDGPDPAHLPKGATVGRYVVAECIGAGAMGVVYTAHDPDLGRKVALKLVRTEAGATSQRSARALREAQAMARLSHPNVIAVHDVGTFGDGVFLAMELVQGGTLTDWLARQPRSWREVVAMMTLAGEGLAAAHAVGLIHRDFKLDNVLVGDDGRVRVTDFGLARAAGDMTSKAAPPSEGPAELYASMTQTGTVVGTPAYMAPEQLDGGAVDARADLFSFSVAFYEALYGERPFEGTSLDELRARMKRGEIRLAPAGSRVPAWLRKRVVSGLAADPAKRPPSMPALLEAVRRGLERERMRLAVVSAGALVAGTLAVLVVQHSSLRGRASPAGSASGDPAVLTALAAPASSNAEALRAYQSGIMRLRDGDGMDAIAKDLRRATELDPGLAAAHLRFALTQFWQYPAESRDHLAHAIENRYALSDRDLLLLTAAQAWIQKQPADDDAFARLTEEAATRNPGDSELAYFAGNAFVETSEFQKATDFARRATELDPAFGGAYYEWAEARSYSGDVAGALSVVDACIAHAPRQGICLGELAKIDQQEGNCARLAETSQLLMTKNPSDDVPYWWMANAAFMLGRPEGAVREILHQHVARLSPGLLRRSEIHDKWAMDVLTGDFPSALARARELDEVATAAADARRHALAAVWTSELLFESGRADEGAKVARDFLERRGALLTEPRRDDLSMAYDPVPVLLLAERRGGLLANDDFEKQRQAWVDAWTKEARSGYRPYVWLHGFAAPADTADDSARALAALPGFGAVPRFMPWTLGDAYIGTTYFLAGRAADALPYLGRAARSCKPLKHPIEQTRAHLVLGRALAATGDREGACSALRVVLTRWGKATPRSVTADEARALMGTLSCPAP